MQLLWGHDVGMAMRWLGTGRRLALLALGAMPPAWLLAACQVLPELPRLPRLPNATELREAVAPTSKGATLGDAILISRVLADDWSTSSPSLVEAEGKSIDVGGRNGGYRGGIWRITWRIPDSDKGLRVDLRSDGQATHAIILPPGAADLGGRSLDGLLDSPVAIQAGALGAGRCTLILNRAHGKARYNLVAEDEPRFVLIDAITGQKIEP